jgi:hypothetical protein
MLSALLLFDENRLARRLSRRLLVRKENETDSAAYLLADKNPSLIGSLLQCVGLLIV